MRLDRGASMLAAVVTPAGVSTKPPARLTASHLPVVVRHTKRTGTRNGL